MSDKTFTASNGYEIMEDGGELDFYYKHGGLYTRISGPLGDALREYYEHERDTELGRVRWPENPDYVIYRDPEHDDEHGRCVQVFHEPTTNKETAWEWWPTEVSNTSEVAARWYFTEGPGKPERPWEDAQAGEVWRIGLDGQADTYLVKEPPSGTPYFLGQVSSFYADSERITAGRKLLNADGSQADDQD